MFRKLIATTDDRAMVAARIFLGIIFFAHGAQKMLGWFGGYGFNATMTGFEHSGIPAVLAFLDICAEFFGGIGLILGLLGRVAAFGVAVVMCVAILRVHLPNGFFMNWAGNQRGEGFEYHLLVLGICIAVMVGGSGALSIDRLLMRPRDRLARAAGVARAA